MEAGGGGPPQLAKRDSSLGEDENERILRLASEALARYPRHILYVTMYG